MMLCQHLPFLIHHSLLIIHILILTVGTKVDLLMLPETCSNQHTKKKKTNQRNKQTKQIQVCTIKTVTCIIQKKKRVTFIEDESIKEHSYLDTARTKTLPEVNPRINEIGNDLSDAAYHHIVSLIKIFPGVHCNWVLSV